MKVFIHRHQNKADGLTYALQSQGHIVTNELPLSLALIDHDGPPYYQSMIEQLSAENIPILLYTHGALSYVAWDGLWKAHSDIIAYLAISQIEKTVMEFYGYPHPIHVVGWYWSSIKPSRPLTGDRVLFAPIHPLGNGFIPEPAKEANKKAFLRLLREDIDLTVYYLGDLQGQGLWTVDKVHYVKSAGVNRDDLFCQYDCVVSYGTFAYLAVASGIPTYMYAQDIPPWDGHNESEVRYAANFDEYKHLLQYPYDLDTTEILFEFDQPACLEEWKAQHIGQPLDPANLCNILEQYAH